MNGETRPEPRDGDVVIVREANSRATYSLQQLSAGPQISCASRNGALQLARSFARSQAVDIWYFDGQTHTLLEVHRPDQGRTR